MLYLAFIYHMHQPYYKNLLTQETSLPWVRLHGTKDYLDMVQILRNYPAIHQTFNLVPSLIEQIEDYANRTVKDKFLELSYKPAAELTHEDKEFLLQNFFFINKERVIALFPRYYDLYFKKQAGKEFSNQDYLDLQLWFNLAWIDPSFRQNPEIERIIDKGRFFTEEEKQVVLDKQIEILEEIVPAYKKFILSGQIEVSVTPYYHPILPLLYSTKIAKEANPRTILPKIDFSYPEDARAQIDLALNFYQERFGAPAIGMWPSEESVCEHILPFIMQSGINWIVTDEVILFKSLKKKKRDARLIYQPYLLKREEGNLNIIFRDRNLSDLIGFIYYRQKTEDAVNDLMHHLENIHKTFGDEDILVTIAMDGENAWEYYPNDGHDFLNLLYQRLSESKILRTVTVSEYLKTHPATSQIKRLAAGSWIYGNFGKWMDNPYKARAWEWLARAREELERILKEDKQLATNQNLPLAWKQIYAAEGSDWFWWYGEDPNGDFDRLFRMHLTNFYTLIQKEVPAYLNRPLSA
jgi:alpha-amylase/alpha-mannosidase (GH57 family)